MSITQHPIRVAAIATIASASALLVAPAAATQYEGNVTSTYGDAYVLVAVPVPGPVDASDGGCGVNQCAFGRFDGSNGLQHFNLSEQAGYLAPPASVQGMVRQSGQVRVVATGPGAPSFVDFTIDLWLDGSMSGSFVGGNATSTLSASFATQGLMGGGGSGQYRISQAWSATPQPPLPPLLEGFTRIGEHVLRGTITHVAVGQWFELSTTLSGQIGAIGEAGASFSYTLSPLAGGLIAQLPVGLSFESPDWAIVDNHWCPGGCAALVPEPPAALLALLGLGMLGWRRPAQAP